MLLMMRNKDSDDEDMGKHSLSNNESSKNLRRTDSDLRGTPSTSTRPNSTTHKKKNDEKSI